MPIQLCGRNAQYGLLHHDCPELQSQLKLLKGFEKKLDVGRMRMHPYLQKPWRSKNRKRLMGTLGLSLMFGGAFSYFTMQVFFLQMWEAALCGGALSFILFLIANFCVCVKASRVQDLNSTIAEVSADYANEFE